MSSTDFMLEPGNLSIAEPYWIAGKSGALTLPAATNPVACLQHLGRLGNPGAGAGSVLAVPLRISKIMGVLALTSGATGTAVLELYKGAVTTQHSSGGNTRTPVARKTSDRSGKARSIAASETNLYISTT